MSMLGYEVRVYAYALNEETYLTHRYGTLAEAMMNAKIYLEETKAPKVCVICLDALREEQEAVNGQVE